MTSLVTPRRSNNLDALRLAGALAVILGHSYPLRGFNEFSPVVLGYLIHTFGVVVFFSISGYLITASWGRTRDPISYLLARSLRIFPALVVVVAVSALVLGPLVTVLPSDVYFDQPFTWDYLTNNLRLRPQFELPGVFASNVYPNAVNGSLWTLGPEFACYLAVPLLLIVPRTLRLPVMVGALLLVLHWAEVPRELSPLVWGTILADAAEMWVFFAAGAVLRLLHERWKGIFRADVAVALVAAYVVALGMWPADFTRFSWVALPYAVLTVGLASTPHVRRASRFGDVSYGLYLWAFPVQQTVVHVAGVQVWWLNLLIVVTVTTTLAWLSWHLIERPSMALKDRVDAARRRKGTRRGAPASPTDSSVALDSP